MGSYIAEKLIGLLEKVGKNPKSSRVGVLGLSFKENVSDLRNSRVVDIIATLRERGIRVLVHDPFANATEVEEKFGLELSNLAHIEKLDGLVLAVPHAPYLDMSTEQLCSFLVTDGIFIDVKSVVNTDQIPHKIMYWAL
jgi:UDP-N-acetyl-D-galactosamine dehydrogenase